VPGRQYRIEGVVLKGVGVRERDLLVTLLTRDGSKLRATAWGARNLTSHKMGHLEPLTRVELSLNKNRDLDSVSQAQGLESFAVLRRNLESTARALYVVEVVEGFAGEGVANPPLYDLLLGTLRSLQESEGGETVVCYFQLSLLMVTGFMPELYQCVECREEIEPGQHRFSVDLGGVLCTRCTPGEGRVAPISIQALKVLRYFHRTRKFNPTELSLSGALHRELRSLLDGAVQYWLDREVKARAFMDTLGPERMGALPGAQSTGL
jgi:DNA repair protein RecO (recombination protein O)